MFTLPVRIYWEDTDAGGVVYHARYVAFLERARSEWMRANGHGQASLQSDNLVFAVRAMTLDFLKPARLDDALDVTCELAECRRASLVFRQSVLRDREPLLQATVRIAALDANGFRPTPIPPALHAQLAALESPHRQVRARTGEPE